MEHGRTKKTAKNALFGLSNQLATLILNFISRTVFIRVLGAGFLGINGLFTDLLMMLSLADLGLNSAMLYSYFKPLAEKDEAKISALAHFYKVIYRVIAVFVFLIGLAMMPFLDKIVNLETPIPNLRMYYLLFLFNTIISYFFVYKGSIIDADQKNYILSRNQLIINTLRIIAQTIVLMWTANYYFYIGLMIIGTLSNNLIISAQANRLYPFIRKPARHLDEIEKKGILHTVKSVFIYKLSGVLLNGTNNTLISVLVGTIWVGLYSNYLLIINTLTNLIGIVYAASTSSIGNLIVKEKPQKRFEVFSTLQAMSLVIGAFTTVCLYLLINDLIAIWIGRAYVLSEVIVLAILSNFYLACVMQPIWSFREATGLYLKTKYTMLFAAIENIILSIILGKIMGVSGILFASAIARLNTYFIFEPKFLFSDFFMESIKKFYFPLFRNLLLTGVLMFGLARLTNHWVVLSWIDMFIKTGVLGTIVLVLVLAVYFRTKGFKLLMVRVLDMIR